MVTWNSNRDERRNSLRQGKRNRKGNRNSYFALKLGRLQVSVAVTIFLDFLVRNFRPSPSRANRNRKIVIFLVGLVAGRARKK